MVLKLKKLIMKMTKEELEHIGDIFYTTKEIPEDDRDEKQKKYKDFFRINLKFVSEYNTHLLPASAEAYNFEKLSNEENNAAYRGILWKNGRKSKTKTKVNLDHKFNLDDIVYLYYSDLPDGIPRILLQGKIIFNGYYGYKDKKIIEIEKFNNRDGCWFYNDNDYVEDDKITKKDKIFAIRFEICKAINCYNMNNVITKEELIKYNKNVNSAPNKETKKEKFHIQGKQYIENVYDKKLVEELTNLFEKCGRTYKDYKNAFITECAFKNYNGLKNPDGSKFQHTTFIKKNKLPYYECHHLIEQNMLKNKVDESIIENLNNKFMLCPTCHRRIHMAESNEIKNMIDYLFDNNSKVNELKKILLENEKVRKLIQESKNIKDDNISDEDIKEWITKSYYHLK